MNNATSKSLSSVPWWLVLIQSILNIFVGIFVVAGAMIGLNDLLAAFRGAGGAWPCSTLLVRVAVLPRLIGIAEPVGGTFAFFLAFRLLSIQGRERK